MNTGPSSQHRREILERSSIPNYCTLLKARLYRQDSFKLYEATTAFAEEVVLIFAPALTDALLPIPRNALPTSSHFALELKHTIEQSLGSRRTAGNVEIDWDDAITAAHDRIRV